MRIIRGRFGRRKLLANPGLTTRPITDRVKETLFEHLHDALPGQRVADVFSGTGTLGLEAISRGAKSCLFLERDREAFDLLKQNVASLCSEGEAMCWNTDVFRTSFRPRGAEVLLPFDTVFFDPPYKMVEGIHPGTPLYKSLKRLARDGITRTGSLLLFRTPDRVQFELPPVWQPYWKLEFSSMDIHWYHRAEAATEPEESDAEPGE